MSSEEKKNRINSKKYVNDGTISSRFVDKRRREIFDQVLCRRGWFSHSKRFQGLPQKDNLFFGVCVHCARDSRSLYVFKVPASNSLCPRFVVILRKQQQQKQTTNENLVIFASFYFEHFSFSNTYLTLHRC